jgi:hypothetical protein
MQNLKDMVQERVGKSEVSLTPYVKKPDVKLELKIVPKQITA